MKLIVYGTLKENNINSLNNFNAIKITDLELDGYTMYTNGAYPMVVEGSGTIHGELWEVPDDMISLLDSYEGHPSLFKRTYLNTFDAEMYLYQRDISMYRRIHNGIF